MEITVVGLRRADTIAGGRGDFEEWFRGVDSEDNVRRFVSRDAVSRDLLTAAGV